MIKKSRKIIASLLMVLSLVSVFQTVSAFADSRSDEDFLNNQCTQVKSKTNTILFKKDGKYYLRGSDNYMLIIPRSTFHGDFYAQDDGSIAINKWIYAYDNASNVNKNVWRYFDSDGVSLKGYQTLNGVKYYFSNRGGNLGIGWFHDGSNDWHYSNPDGSVHGEGWVQDDGKWYYINSDGIMLRDTITPDGYHVNKKGVCV